MFKIVSVLVLLLLPLTSPAQVVPGGPPEAEKNCQELLTGEASVLLKNEIKKNKQALYQSELIQKYCPSLEQMPDDEAKIKAVSHVMTVHSYFQNWCKPDSNQQQNLPAKSPNERPGAKAWFGGIYYLPVDASFRHKELQGTPCDVTEFTLSAQTQCAVYLAALPDEKNWKSKAFATVARTNSWSKENNVAFRRQLKGLSPECDLRPGPGQAKANKGLKGQPAPGNKAIR